MNVFNRLLVIAIDLAAMGGACLMILLAANVIAPEQLTQSSWLFARLQAADAFAAQYQVTLILICLVIMALGLMLLYYELRPASMSEPRLVLQQEALGKMTVSLAGVRELASHAARQVAGVIEATTKVKAKAKGLRILSRVSVEPSAKLVDLGEQIQKRIKATLEENLGYPVANVSVKAQLSPLSQRRSAAPRVH